MTEAMKLCVLCVHSCVTSTESLFFLLVLYSSGRKHSVRLVVKVPVKTMQ